VTPAEVTEMERRLSARDLSFDVARRRGRGSYGPAAYLPAADAIRRTVEPKSGAVIARPAVAAMNRLDDRSRTFFSGAG